MSVMIMGHLIKKKYNCRHDRSEKCPPDILGGRSPDKAGSSLMNKTTNCRQARSEGCPGDIPGGRSPKKSGSDLVNKNTNCQQYRFEGCPADMPDRRSPDRVSSHPMKNNTICRPDPSKGCPAALSAGHIFSYPCASSVMSGTDVVLNLFWVCAYRVTTLLSFVEAVAWL